MKDTTIVQLPSQFQGSIPNFQSTIQHGHTYYHIVTNINEIQGNKQIPSSKSTHINKKAPNSHEVKNLSFSK